MVCRLILLTGADAGHLVTMTYGLSVISNPELPSLPKAV